MSKKIEGDEFDSAVQHVIKRGIEMLNNAQNTSFGKLLTYHNLEHALYVHDAAVSIGRKLMISEHNIALLRISAIFHDVYQHYGPANELHSALCAVNEMARYDTVFTGDDCLSVMQIIMATKVRFGDAGNMLQKGGNNSLCETMCDADLCGLGMEYERYIAITKSLFQEMNNLGNKISWYDFLINQERLLQNHAFMTPAAISYFPHQQENLRRVQYELQNRHNL